MPIQTNLSNPPYGDTVPVTSDYYRILTKPGVSLQSRELIELQSMFATQIERFGDNVLQAGTVVSGCNFLFYDPYPYVKLLDQDVNGNPVVVSAFANLTAINTTTGLRATVVDTADGFVSSDPNLKTLYLKYLNTGFSGNVTTFHSGDTIQIYDSVRNGIEQVNILGGGQGFANTTTLFGVSALAVTLTGGSLTNGQYIVNGLGTNVQIVNIDSTTLANSGQLILSVAPRPIDLANVSVNSSAWTFSNSQSFTNSGNTASGYVSGVIGSGYQGLPVTDSLGSIQQVLTLNKGFGYTTPPYVTMQSANNTGGYASLNLQAQNYVDQVVVASTANAVGNGYAFGVSEGVTYFNGTFLRVAPQSVVVSKYSDTPNGVSVVFSTVEQIVTSDVDPTLNDPAAGPNNGAPGADRLNIEVQLAIVNTAMAEANSNVLALVEWNEGNPYIQRAQTQYSTVGAAIAQTVEDGHGDFYIDPFLVTSVSSLANDSPYTPYWNYDLVVDPGSAYIQGYKVQTQSSFVQTTPFQFSSAIAPFSVSLNYGNYVQLTGVGGTFQYNTGDVVQLYNTAKGFTSNSSLVKTQNTSPVGTQIGTARIRSMVPVSGTPGTNTAVYNLYLFDVQMNSGGAFSNVASVYYNGTQKGIGDVVQIVDSKGTSIAAVTNTNSSQMLWRTGVASVKNVNAGAYVFSSLNQNVSLANSGVLTDSLASSQQTFPWVGTTLSAQQASEIYLVPQSTSVVTSNVTTSTWVANTSTANLVNAAGGAALTNFVAGDWITLVGNTTQTDLKQITQVVNNTFMILDSAPGFSNGVIVLARTFPAGLPIPMTRAGVSANVSANGTVLSVNLGFAVNSATPITMTLGAPVQITNATPTAKTVNRKAYVKLCTSNNAGGTTGPWCLGIPDVFRLRSVYVGNSSVSNTGTDFSPIFAVDNGQTSDYLGPSWLYMDPTTSNPLGSNSYILVEFDYFSSPTGLGYYATPSYTQTANVYGVLAQDSSPLANLTSSASTWEIPEFFTDQGTEVDLTQCIDFRPYSANTVAPGSNSSTAPLNPANTLTFSATEKLFPYPGTVFTSNLEYYVPRIDTVYVTSNGSIGVITGKDIFNGGTSSPAPAGTMKIADILMPEYPNLPANRSASLTQLINTQVVSAKYACTRTSRHSITLLSTISQDAAKVYTNKDIADLETRISNLEYYVNLGQLETATQTMVIPSSSDPTVNRYQYGFFADDFTTTSLMDLGNPDYAATMESGDVVPSKLEWEVYLGDDFTGAQPYTTQTLITQQNATIGTQQDPKATPQCAVSLANTIAFQLVYRNALDGTNGFAPQSGAVDTVTVNLADASHMSGALSSGGSSGIDSASANNLGSGIVTLFFYAYDNPVEFQIVQGNTVVADSSSAVALSANDVLNLTTGTVMNQWFNDQTSLYLKNPVTVSGAFVEYAGKVTWNYSGAGSQSLTIRTTNGNGVHNWRWVLSYPINGDSAGCTPPPPVHTCPSGYVYDPTSGGCIIPGVTIIDKGPAVNVNWYSCGNAIEGAAWEIAAVLKSGYSVGTIHIGLGLTNEQQYYGSTQIVGTLADFMNPNSPQNQAILNWDYANEGTAANGTLAAQLAALGVVYSNGSYVYNPTTASQISAEGSVNGFQVYQTPAGYTVDVAQTTDTNIGTWVNSGG